MRNYEPSMSFDEDTARSYDAQRFSKTPSRRDRYVAVAFVDGLAGDGPALELAIGTGWIALPLSGRRIRVDGIDFSRAMVERLCAKPGRDQLSVTIGDFADVPEQGSYRLIFVVANTLFNLLTYEDQARCFENVTVHPTGDVSFVIEASCPGYLYRLRGHQYVDAEAVEINEVRLNVARHDPMEQLLDESHVSLPQEGISMHPIATRYAWPAELDLMARIAGLRPKERWDAWNREPLTGGRNVVSAYGR